MKKIIIALCALLLLLICWVYAYRFFPQQQMPIGKPISVMTPEPEKYHNDCLHPCVRVLKDGSFVMVQSPYYKWNDKIENPMLYFSNELKDWGMGRLLEDTPLMGYNSDPAVFVDDTSVYAFWRAFGTPLCMESEMNEIVLGGKLTGLDECLIEKHNLFGTIGWMVM